MSEMTLVQFKNDYKPKQQQQMYKQPKWCHAKTIQQRITKQRM